MLNSNWKSLVSRQELMLVKHTGAPWRTGERGHRVGSVVSFHSKSNSDKDKFSVIYNNSCIVN